MDELSLIKGCGMTLNGMGFGLWGAWLANRDVARAGVLGRRGLERVHALDARGLFAAFDPVIRWLADWIATIPMPRRRAQIDRYLHQAGDAWGVTANELVAMVLWAALLGCVAGFSLGVALDARVAGAVGGAVCAPGWIALWLHSYRQRRFLEIDRGLPAIIDLVALCMGAGLDLPGALQLVVSESAGRHSVLKHELQAVLRALSVGHTRALALRSFQERAPTASVHDFVSTVVQAEEKGTPLSDALQIQAGVLRGRRTVLAEEAAARAGVWMMLPLMLLLACTMLLAMGGMVIRGMESTP